MKVHPEPAMIVVLSVMLAEVMRIDVMNFVMMSLTKPLANKGILPLVTVAEVMMVAH